MNEHDIDLVIEALGPVLQQHVQRNIEASLRALPLPRDGRDGESPTLTQLHPLIALAASDVLTRLDVPALIREAIESLPPGERGPRGERGEKGERGTQGLQGRVGTRGEKGDRGEKGEQGLAGPRGEKGERGDPGVAGKDGAHGLVGPQGDRGERGEAGLAGAQGAPGERGEKGLDGAPGERGLDGAPGVAGERGERGEKGLDGAPGERGEKGLDGISGRDGAPGERGLDGAPGERGEKGLDGAPGAVGERGERGEKGDRGERGESVSVEQVTAIVETTVTRTVESLMARYQLEFERRAAETLQHAIDHMPKPKDGKDGVDGKNGRDAFPLDTFTASFDPNARLMNLSLGAGDQKIEQPVKIPVPMHVGVWDQKNGMYESGHMVTFGGSTFIAMRDTDAKPETDDSWKLCVKRGRDGKDGKPGEKGDPGRDGKDGKPKW